MELKEFVSNSLTQIIAGIQEAQAASVDTGAWINPAGSAITNKAGTPVIKTPDGQGYLHEIQFDVALTVSNDQKAGAGAGLRVLGASLGQRRSDLSESSRISIAVFDPSCVAWASS